MLIVQNKGKEAVYFKKGQVVGQIVPMTEATLSDLPCGDKGVECEADLSTGFFVIPVAAAMVLNSSAPIIEISAPVLTIPVAVFQQACDVNCYH